jgi:hypothetical protein
MNATKDYSTFPVPYQASTIEESRETEKKRTSKFCCSLDKRTTLAAMGAFLFISGYSLLILELVSTRNVTQILQLIAPITMGAFFVGRSIGPLAD